jgi:hypothetical protein
MTAAQASVAGWVGIISAAWRVIGSCGSSADGSRAEAYRDSTGHGCAINATTIDATTINAAAISRATIGASTIDTTAINAGATNGNASSIGEGVIRNSRKTPDANDDGCSKRKKSSTRHD